MNVDYFKKLHGYFLEDIFLVLEADLISLVKEEDINTFSRVTGDTNPIHIDDEFAKKSIFKKKIAHGFLSASFISAVIGTKLPGPGCIYVRQSLRFLAPVFPGDKITTKVKVVHLGRATDSLPSGSSGEGKYSSLCSCISWIKSIHIKTLHQ